MKNAEKGLGNVDLFGLDEFGAPAGLNPLWGAVIGSGLGTLGAIGTRQFTRFGRHSELVGLAAGALSSGAMLFFEGTRDAGWTGLASSLLNNGLRQLELMFFVPELQAGTQGVEIEPTQALGIATVSPSQALLGEGDSDMPQLVGANLAQANDHVQLVGGPGLAQHAGHWGATVIPS